MKTLHEVSAKQVMNTEPETVEKTQSLGSIKDFMEEEGLRAVAVEHDGEFKGAISYRELIRHAQYNPGSSKLEKVIHRPPEFEASDSLVDVAKLRIESGRKLLVALEGDKLKGLIADQEFLDVSGRIKEFENYSTRNLASTDLIEVFEEDPLDKARNLMLDKNISRLPVLDSEGELTGIIRSTDLLKMIVPKESQSDSGSGPRGFDGDLEGSGEKQSMSNITVDQVMNTTPVTEEGFVPASEAVELMQKRDQTDVIFTDNSYPEAIVTVKDFVDYIRDQGQHNMVLVNLVGLEVEEEKAAVHDKIATQLRGSLGRKVEKPEEISMHFKKSDKDGNKHRYEVIAKFYSEFGITTATVEDWDLMTVVDQALDEINVQVRKENEKRKP
jgi:CBS domain-containing protein